MKPLSHVLKTPAPRSPKTDLESLQLKMLKAQQALWGLKKRAVVVFEGFDAAGKGTCIRRLTEGLDPRGFRVVPIGAPTGKEVGQHYLQRFWANLPDPGILTVFDRSWYGRVLVERVEELIPEDRVHDAYREINAFEKMLEDDGIVLVKIFLAVSKEEQLARFRARLEDPMKNWKITEDDVRNRKRWDDYVSAGNVVLKKCPGWTLIRSDDKDHARKKSLETVVQALARITRSYKPERARRDKLAKALLGH